MKKVVRMIISCVLTVGCMFSLFGCTAKEETTSEKKIIAVSIVPQETFVKAVCGDLVDVVTMVPPGNNPANYEPTTQEMIKFNEAELYFTIGVPTEEANLIPKVSTNTTIVSLQDIVSEKYPERTFESGGRDPHIWLSPKRVKVIIETIRDEMIKIDPDNKDTYTANADAYLKQLDDLDNDIKSALSNVSSKSFIVYHPAFGYLADDYGLTMYSLEEDGKEATPQHLQDMIDMAKENNIKVIFYQEEIDSTQSASFAEEIGGKTAPLAPLSPDYINNLETMAKTMAEAME